MNLIDRAKNIITTPKTEWNVIAAEPADPSKIITTYVIPLAGLAAIAAFIGYGFVGSTFMGIRIAGMKLGLYQALVVFINAIASVYITAMIIDMLAPSFESEKNFGRSFQLVAYSSTPAWIGGLLAIIPAISFVGVLFGLYGLYLLYLGLPRMKSTPEVKQTTYFVVSLLVTIVVYAVISYVLMRILSGVLGVSNTGAVIF